MMSMNSSVMVICVACSLKVKYAEQISEFQAECEIVHETATVEGGDIAGHSSMRTNVVVFQIQTLSLIHI